MAFLFSQKIVEQYEGSIEMSTNLDIGLSLQMNFKTLTEDQFIDLPDQMRSSQSFMQLKDLVTTNSKFSNNNDKDYIQRPTLYKSSIRSKSLANIPMRRKPQQVRNNLIRMSDQIQEAKRMKTIASM